MKLLSVHGVITAIFAIALVALFVIIGAESDANNRKVIYDQATRLIAVRHGILHYYEAKRVVPATLLDIDEFYGDGIDFRKTLRLSDTDLEIRYYAFDGYCELYAPGVDGDYDINKGTSGHIIYDPTNGLVSNGDLYRRVPTRGSLIE